MGFLSPLVSLVSGYLEARAIGKLGKEAGDYADRWFRLLASVIITSYVVFPGVWGAITLAAWSGGKLLAVALNSPDLPALPAMPIGVALGVGFASGLFITSLLVYRLWTSNELTKGIEISVPSWLATTAVNQNVTTTERS